MTYSALGLVFFFLNVNARAEKAELKKCVSESCQSIHVKPELGLDVLTLSPGLGVAHYAGISLLYGLPYRLPQDESGRPSRRFFGAGCSARRGGHSCHLEYMYADYGWTSFSLNRMRYRKAWYTFAAVNPAFLFGLKLGLGFRDHDSAPIFMLGVNVSAPVELTTSQVEKEQP